MAFRVQFTINDDEMDMLEKQAIEEKYPNIAELSKARTLRYDSDTKMVALYKEMLDKIEALPAGTVFCLRDIIDTPPILLGRWLYDSVKTNRIISVKHVDDDSIGPEKYIKE